MKMRVGLKNLTIIPMRYFRGPNTGTPPITLFFGPVEIYRVIRKTVLKEDRFGIKWYNKASKNARVR